MSLYLLSLVTNCRLFSSLWPNMVALVYLIIYDHIRPNYHFFHILFPVTIWSIYFKWTVQIKGMASCAITRISIQLIEEKWSLHSFLTTAPQQDDVAGNILLFFCFVFISFCKKIIKYYQPRQLVVRLLWEMSVGIISHIYIYIYIYIQENVIFTTPIQQLHNNPSHEGGLHTLGPTFIWRVVVQLLWRCSAKIKSHIYNSNF